ncbi:AGE family epimerase/isomerase [Natrialba taiwanensis]|uniref:N-acylglucosamine 2-epimerase n=1 Tax=Natrialba taiwanensis DSM 12281 TaxID=1230458 RepID=M0ADQ6_9EURY|nr:AGE family epimerase/isomerase [Natrialba taiwanensis]ELY96895.1 N-acylglucosamine 2-epimerase [Natrialba taiwanensis DSM 12281]
MPDVATLKDEYLSSLEQTLTNNVLDFWFPRSIDEEHGGFITSYDEDGEFAGNSNKQVVTQARMVWLTARLAREGYGDEYYEIADHGFAFLIDEMWDEADGGFVWEVQRDGTTTKPNKHLYGQSFGLYALSEYYRATGSDEAAEYAHELVDLMDEHTKDDEHGGYVEYFTPHWEPITEGQTYLENIEPDWSPKESGDSVLDPTLKLMNTHLHLMEAFTTYYEAFDTSRGRDRLHELLDILTNTVYRKKRGFCTDKYDPDWSPKLDDEEFQVVSYGHDLENVWLVMEATSALGLPQNLYREFFETLWDYSLEYGYDEDRGGFYFYGGFDEPASFRVKAWWVQAECMTSALRTYECTGDDRYLDVFADTWEFLDEYQIDRKDGEWHSGVDDDLDPVGRKGAVYKAAYHNGRALLECIATLKRL